MAYKLGSLFDGSGGFPLAGSLCGIEPAWAAEVEPYPIAVTRSRFPSMKHLGDISKVNGAELEPVDIITFGSPCQDLSVAGKRAGLKHEANGDEETTRSGLFMEAVRIIKEMRRATNGEYPTFALWENVPGAFSSNKGEDFRIVCEELIKIVEPAASMPAVPQNGWPYADSYVGNGWSLAYRVFDAQYWGVPQRRRRIHLVLDLRGERAREVLFEREGVRGYFTEGRTPWQSLATYAEGSAGADDREGEGFDGYNGDLTGAVSATLGVNCGVSTGRNGIIECRGDGGRRQLAAIAYGIVSKGNGEAWPIEEKHMVPYTLKIRSGCEGGGKGALVQEDKSATLATNNDQYLFQPVPNLLLDDQGGQQVNVRTDDKSPTLRAEAHGNVPAVVMEPVGINGDIAGTLDASYYKGCGMRQGTEREVVVIPIHDKATRYQGGGQTRNGDGAGNGLGVGEPGDPMNTLTSGDRHAVRYPASGKGAVGTLMASMATKQCLGDQEAQSGDYHIIEEQPIDRAFFNQGQNAQYDPQYYTDGTNPTLVARGPSAVAVRYIVRRLTPTECARLQGFADRWGDIDEKDSFTPEEFQFWHDVRNTHAAINGKKVQEYTEKQTLAWYNKLHTDSAEYKMWGNGIALPPALYCIQGMVDAMETYTEEDDDSWML